MINFPQNYKDKDLKNKNISQLKVISWLNNLENNNLFENKELLKEVNLNSLIEKIKNLDSKKINKDFYEKAKFAQYDEILDKPSVREEKDNFDQLLKMYDLGSSIDEIKKTEKYQNLSRLEQILLEDTLNPKPIKPIRYFGDE